MINLKTFLSHHSEPLAYILYAGSFLFYYLKVDRGSRFKMLLVFYLIGAVLLTKAVIERAAPNNIHIYNLLYLITSLFLSNYFFNILQSRVKKTIAVITGLITLVYYMMNTSEVYFDSLGYVTSSTGVVVLIFFYFHQVLNNVNEQPLSHNFDFWYICVQLAYHLGSFAIFLTYNYFTIRYFEIQERGEIGTILTYLWVVHNVLLFLGSIAVIVGVVWIYRKRLPSS